MLLTVLFDISECEEGACGFACRTCVSATTLLLFIMCRVHTLRLCRESAEPAAKFYVLNANLHYNSMHIPTARAVGPHCDLFAVQLLLSACGIN